jgi:hypothetical protein
MEPFSRNGILFVAATHGVIVRQVDIRSVRHAYDYGAATCFDHNQLYLQRLPSQLMQHSSSTIRKKTRQQLREATPQHALL